MHPRTITHVQIWAFRLPIRIPVAGPVAATKGPEALGRAGRSMFRHSRGPIDHLGLLSSRITTAWEADGACLSDSREHSMESMTYEVTESLSRR